ncbi:MAG: hypothetical protein ACLTER_10850 [Ruminococcus sp.]
MLREKIRKKLKSEQGTSIFFGLLLFLVASILSVVMLEGAVTTVKTVASDRESEQNQLSCTSAAQVLRDSITNIKLSATVTVKKIKRVQIQRQSKMESIWISQLFLGDSIRLCGFDTRLPKEIG